MVVFGILCNLDTLADLLKNFNEERRKHLPEKEKFNILYYNCSPSLGSSMIVAVFLFSSYRAVSTG
jgi:hypothetical protein